jgi:hypothetical protein
MSQGIVRRQDKVMSRAAIDRFDATAGTRRCSSEGPDNSPSFKAKRIAPLRPHIVVGHGDAACRPGENLRAILDQMLL